MFGRYLALAAHVGRRRCRSPPKWGGGAAWWTRRALPGFFCGPAWFPAPNASREPRARNVLDVRSGLLLQQEGGVRRLTPADRLAQWRRLQRGCARPSRDSAPCRPQRGTVGHAVIFTAEGIHPDRSGGPARSSLLAGTVPSSCARRARTRRGARLRGRARAGLALPWSWGWAWSSSAGAGSSDQ